MLSTDTEVLPLAHEGALNISEKLARVLVLYRERRQIAAKPTLSERALTSVESSLGVDIPHDLVALFASTRRGLDEVIALTEEARDAHDLPRNQLVIANADEPLRQWRARVTLGDGAVSRDAETEMFFCSKSGKREGEFLSVAEFARGWLNVQRAETEKERVRVDEALVAFRPAITADTKGSAQRYVRHRHFGDGRVIREVDGGRKLDVEFEHERILVLASFCEAVGSEHAAQ